MTRSKQIELCFENSIQYIGQMCFYAFNFRFIFLLLKQHNPNPNPKIFFYKSTTYKIILKWHSKTTFVFANKILPNQT
jgi:hypothetical protein